jgi:hypothetical protein
VAHHRERADGRVREVGDCTACKGPSLLTTRVDDGAFTIALRAIPHDSLRFHYDASMARSTWWKRDWRLVAWLLRACIRSKARGRTVTRRLRSPRARRGLLYAPLIPLIPSRVFFGRRQSAGTRACTKKHGAYLERVGRMRRSEGALTNARQTGLVTGNTAYKGRCGQERFAPVPLGGLMAHSIDLVWLLCHLSSRSRPPRRTAGSSFLPARGSKSEVRKILSASLNSAGWSAPIG